MKGGANLTNDPNKKYVYIYIYIYEIHSAVWTVTLSDAPLSTLGLCLTEPLTGMNARGHTKTTGPAALPASPCRPARHVELGEGHPTQQRRAVIGPLVPELGQ